jgi:acetyl-CoA acetyltransferase
LEISVTVNTKPAAMTGDPVILTGARTPIGRYGGPLAHIRTDDLLGLAMRAACERAAVEPEQVRQIAAGCVNVAHEGMGDIARWGELAAGFPDDVPAYTVNRFCASSLTATIKVAHAVGAGDFSLAIGAGVESLSRSGFDEGRGAVLAARGGVHARHDVGRRGPGRRTRSCWRARPTWR